MSSLARLAAAAALLLLPLATPVRAQGPASSYPQSYVRLGDRVVFVADDGEHGFEPWVSDSTGAGTRPLADLCPGECGLARVTWTGLTDHGAFFTSSSTDGWRVLWATDGTPEGTEVVWRGDHRLGNVPVAGEIRSNDLFFFHVRDDGTWATDGTADGTRPLGTWVETFGAELDERLWFKATHPEWGNELWSSDGTPEGTAPLGDLHPDTPWLGGTISALRDRLVYTHSRQEGGQDLWTSDGTVAGTSLVHSFPDGVRQLSRISPLGAHGLVAVGESVESAVLWGTDGTAAGTVPLTDAALRPDYAGASSFRTLWPIDGRAYFAADDGVHGIEPWTSDGTAAGTYRLADTCPGPCSASLGFFYATDDGAVFRVNAEGSEGALWASDGTVAGTRLLLDLSEHELGTLLDYRRSASGRLFYVLHDRTESTRELWSSNGPGSERLLASFPYYESSGGVFGELVGERLLFTGWDFQAGDEPWVSDGTPEGTERLADLAPDLVEPPPGAWLTSAELPDFRFKIRITPPGGDPIEGAAEAACLPETACVSGAVAGRPEVFLRVVGPKGNGFLWPNLVKFSTSRVEAWVEQISTGLLRSYDLVGARPGYDVLPGLFDRLGFLPTEPAAAAAGLAAPRLPSTAELARLGTLPEHDGALGRRIARRAAAAVGGPPPPAEGTWLADPRVPGFRFQVRVTNQSGAEQPTRLEAECIAETACVSAALPGRSELFLRVPGPKPNGRLWPTLVRFSTSRIEVWLEQTATGERRYYGLPDTDPEGRDLDGLFDREGFLP